MRLSDQFLHGTGAGGERDRTWRRLPVRRSGSHWHSGLTASASALRSLQLTGRT